MTQITLQDGKLVLHDGKVGTEQACCCGGDCCCKCRVKVTFPGIFDDGDYVNAYSLNENNQETFPCGQPVSDGRIDFVCAGALFLQSFTYNLTCQDNLFTLTVFRSTPCVPFDPFTAEEVFWRVTDVYTFGCDGEPTLASSTEEVVGDIDNECPCGKETGADYTIEVDCNPLP